MTENEKKALEAAQAKILDLSFLGDIVSRLSDSIHEPDTKGNLALELDSLGRVITAQADAVHSYIGRLLGQE